MRRNEKQITDHSVLESIIKEAQVCRLGLSLNNIPAIVPMNFGYCDSVFYFHSAREGKKIEILKQNPLVCFELESKTELKIPENQLSACRWGMKYKSIIGMGNVSFVNDEKEKLKALNTIMQHYCGMRDFQYEMASLKDALIIRLDIIEMTGKKSGY